MSYIQQTFGNQERWVNWDYVDKKDGKKPTKVPKNPRTGGNAMSNNPSTWTNYTFAKSKSERVGIMLHDDLLIGMDIDGTLTDETSLQLIQRANTYTEISPSGNGLRLFLLTETPYHLLRNKKGNFEVYNSVRFLTVTEKPFAQYNIPIRTVSHEELTSILEIVGYPWGKEETEATPVYTEGISILTDSEVLQKMFSASNGKKVEALYNTVTANGGSEDDQAFCMHLAFYCGKDPQQMERIWLSSPIGGRSKTQDRQDYRKRTIENAIKRTSDVYKKKDVTIKKMTPQDFSMDSLLSTTTKAGDIVYIMNTENICRILRNHPEFKNGFRYDSFKNIMEIKDKEVWREMQEGEDVNIQTKISIMFPCFAKVSKLMVQDAMYKIMRENTFDSAKNYITSITWDKEPRLNSWLSKTYGVSEDEYHIAVGTNWLKGLVKRIIYAGCKFDYVLVLEGKQGSRKSTSLNVLCDMGDHNWHVESTITTESKDFFMQMQGKAVVEFSEGETLSRTETMRLKAIITTQSDKMRMPYERTTREFPRRCVFAMTTNKDEYLKDETGNRRWLPVALVFEQANIDWLRENRDQLLAEAYYRVITLKESTWEFPDNIEEIQDSRRIEDTNTDIVLNWYRGLRQDQREEGITVRDAFDGAIRRVDNFKSLDKLEEMRLGGILRGSLKLEKERKMDKGERVNKYYDVKNLHSGYKPTETVQSVVEQITKDLITN